ncbi:MAG: alpha/beta hydrolase [Methanomicrobiaceae archaeon]|nr:alpha/beta hydrolase [Methanomicrobiaceae archaeon]
MNIPLFRDLLLIESGSSFILVGKVNEGFILQLETFRAEIDQPLAPDDVVVVSAPEGGPVRLAIMLLEIVRTYHMPLVVLPRDHPGSPHIRMVVSAGPEVVGTCTIRRGTHPEQHLICTSEKLAGIRIRGVSGGVTVRGFPEETSFSHLDAD